MHDGNYNRHLFLNTRVQRRIDEYDAATVSKEIIKSNEKSLIMVGWKPPEDTWVKFNTNRVTLISKSIHTHIPYQ